MSIFPFFQVSFFRFHFGEYPNWSNCWTVDRWRASTWSYLYHCPLIIKLFVWPWQRDRCWTSRSNNFLIPPGKDRWLATPMYWFYHGPLLFVTFLGGWCLRQMDGHEVQVHVTWQQEKWTKPKSPALRNPWNPGCLIEILIMAAL